jgi:cytochrome c biogenesis factor
VHAFSEGDVGPYLLGFFALIVVVSVGLIGWRGDRLRSPGTIDSPISREGAFLANNVLFSVFAFVVLLGTVFPLIVEALQDRQIVVGEPFFDRLSIPIGLTMLFLMAVAPVLPWRKASTELLRERLFWPAWCGVAALAPSPWRSGPPGSRRCGLRLGGFAAGAALRQLVLATRRQGWRGLRRAGQRRHDRAPRCDPPRGRTGRVQLIVWLWIGGALMAIGTILAAFPGERRRRPTDPVSAPVPAADADAAPPPESTDERTEVSVG